MDGASGFVTAAALTKRLVRLGSSGRWRQALKELSGAGLRVNVVHFNAAARACAGELGAWENALQLLRGMAEVGVEADKVGYSTGLSNCGAQLEWRHSLQLLQEAPRDAVTWASAASACERSRQWPQALAACASAGGSLGAVDAVLQGAAAAAAGAGGVWAGALHLCNGLRVNVICLTTAASAASRASRWRAALALGAVCRGAAPRHAAMAARGGWRSAGELLRSFGGLQLRREAIGFNACLTAVGLVGHWPQTAALLAEMRGVAVVPTEASANTAAAAFSQAGCWPRTVRMLQHMTPALAASEALAVCEQAGRWAETLALLRCGGAVRLTTAALAQAARSCTVARRWRWSLVVLAGLVHGSSERLRRAWPALDTSNLTAEELTQMAWMGAQLSRFTPAWANVAEALAPQLPQLPLPELGRALWSFGTLAVASPGFLKAAAAEAAARLRGGTEVTPRILADLSWGFCSLDFHEASLYLELLEAAGRLVGSLSLAQPRLALMDFARKMLVVLWASSLCVPVPAGMLRLLRLQLGRVGKELGQTQDGEVSRARAGPGNGDAPRIVLDLPDRLVLQKPQGWQARAPAARTCHGAVGAGMATPETAIVASVLLRCFGKGGDLSVVVEAEDGAVAAEFQVWSCLLREWSEVFRAMLNPEHGFQEQQQAKLVIREFSAGAVESCLRFLYSGRLEAHGEMLVEVCVLADKYSLSELQRVACRQLNQEMTAVDACRLCQFATQCGSAQAKQVAMDLIMREPQEALPFAHLLGPQLLDEILDSGALCIEPGELLPLILTWGLPGEHCLDVKAILEKTYVQREVAALEDSQFAQLQPLASEVQCWEILQSCRQKCKRGEHTTDALYTLWERYETAFPEDLPERPPFLGYWVNVIPGTPRFGSGAPLPMSDMGIRGASNALLYLERLARNDEASLNLAENDWLEWMLPNFQLHLEGVSFGDSARVSALERVEMFVSMSGTSWDRVLDSQAWVQRHGPILQGEV
ncbi:unnamed protein product, partial [Effrenium voratum]